MSASEIYLWLYCTHGVFILCETTTFPTRALFFRGPKPSSGCAPHLRCHNGASVALYIRGVVVTISLLLLSFLSPCCFALSAFPSLFYGREPLTFLPFRKATQPDVKNFDHYTRCPVRCCSCLSISKIGVILRNLSTCF